MSWMNASAVAAADRRNAELSKWDHSVESPDGYGRRDAGPEIDPTATPPEPMQPMRWMTKEETEAAIAAEQAAMDAMIAGMMAERDEMDR